MQQSEERTWGMLCHLGALGVIVFPFFGNIIGPLIFWLIKKEQSSFVNDQGKESLNFQISIALYAIGIGILSVVFGALTIILPIFGILMFLVYLALFGISIASIVFVIIAAIAANKGEYYRYPLTIRFLK